MRCKDCKFWSTFSEAMNRKNVWYDVPVQTCAKATYSKCGPRLPDGEENTDRIVYWDYETYCAFLATGPEFGCIHFERRE